MKVAFIAFFVFLLLTIPVFGQVIPTTDELVNKAFELNKEGKYEDSISILNEVLESEPDNITALYYRSSAHIGLEQFKEAKEDLERIFVLRPEPSGGILYNYAVALSGIGEYEEAVQYFELIDEDDHNYFNAQNGKGIALLELLRFEEAVESFDLVIENDPENVTAHLYRGTSLSNLGDYDEALKSIYKARSIDPQNVRAKEALQSTLNQKGLSLLYDDSNPEEAMIYFNKALANNPQDPNAAAYLGMAQSELTKKQFNDIIASVAFALGLSLFGIALTVILYFKPRKQKQ